MREDGPRPNDWPTIIDTMRGDARLSYRNMSRTMGRTDSYMSATSYNLKRGDPSAQVLADMAAACGYRLVLVGHDREIPIRPRPVDGRAE